MVPKKKIVAQIHGVYGFLKHKLRMTQIPRIEVLDDMFVVHTTGISADEKTWSVLDTVMDAILLKEKSIFIRLNPRKILTRDRIVA